MMKLTVDAMGDACPIPVVKTKNAIKKLGGSGVVVTSVDNEIAVQNLTKMANQKGYTVSSQKLGDRHFEVTMVIGDAAPDTAASDTTKEPVVCTPDRRSKTVVVISSDKMGNGDDTLGAALMKAFIFALSQQDTLPDTILFYNGGARLTCENAPTLEDLQSLEAQGVEILTCGTCLNHYGLTDQLKVGGITNMYAIVEKQTEADKIIRP